MTDEQFKTIVVLHLRAILVFIALIAGAILAFAK